MSVRFAISQFMHSLRLPGKRVSVLLFALCWLVLNAQLALASHQCDMRPPVENTAMAHNITMQMPDSPEHMQSQSLLCEKHCAPERTQSDSGSVPLVALPVAPACSPSMPAQRSPPRTGLRQPSLLLPLKFSSADTENSPCCPECFSALNIK
ncbi:hypothetical protein SRABI106_02877 [Rahnella aquatilis]|nr:hypothetical protein SRABI106_02877 [Rahnella aquatilis]